MEVEKEIPKQCSIIIPVYNTRALYLQEAIASAEQQTIPCNVIIVDDGSTREETLQFLAQVDKASSDAVKVYHKNNEGVSVARYYGATKVTTPFLTFLDSDDWLKENAIEELLKKIEEAKADYGEAGVKKRGLKELSENPVFDVIQEDHTLEWNLHGCIFVTDQFVKNCKGYPEIFRGEDVLTKVEYLGYCKKVALVEHPVYVYRSNAESFSNTDSVKQLSIVDAWRRCWEICNELGLERSKEILGKRIVENAIAAMGTAQRHRWYTVMPHYREILYQYHNYVSDVSRINKAKAFVIRYMPYIYGIKKERKK